MDRFKDFTDVLSANEIQSFEKWVKSPKEEINIFCIKGHNMLPIFSSEAIQYAYHQWEIKKGDVFIVSYPKTGKAFRK